MRSMYIFLYHFSLVYLVIAGINWLAGVIVMLLERKHYRQTLSQYSEVTGAIIAFLAPIIYGLGWIFFVPFVLTAAFKKK